MQKVYPAYRCPQFNLLPQQRMNVMLTLGTTTTIVLNRLVANTTEPLRRCTNAKTSMKLSAIVLMSTTRRCRLMCSSRLYNSLTNIRLIDNITPTDPRQCVVI